MNLYSDSDILHGAIRDICSVQTQKRSLKLLRIHVEIALRELSLDSFAKFENDLYEVREREMRVCLFACLYVVYMCGASLNYTSSSIVLINVYSKHYIASMYMYINFSLFLFSLPIVFSVIFLLYCLHNTTLQHIFSLLYNESIEGKKGSVLAIRELINCPSAIPDAKTAKFSQVLSIALNTNTHFELLESIAGVLGYIAKHTPVPLVDFIEAELSRALEWLEGTIPHQRLAACAMLEQLANNTPTLFFVQCKAFFDLIWSPLRDSKERIRFCASQALSACLHDLDKRTYHLQWYCSLYEQVLLGFKEGTLEAVHGSLLVTEELLKYTGDFMLPRYKEVIRMNGSWEFDVYCFL